jgi:hypothetical protein
MKDQIKEYQIDKIQENEYCDKFKRKLTIEWMNGKYSVIIDSDYLEDKIISLDNLDEFFDCTFNKKKFYDLDMVYDFYFCNHRSIQINIWFEININEKLKPIKQDFVFILNEDINKSWGQYFLDIILDRD